MLTTVLVVVIANLPAFITAVTAAIQSRTAHARLNTMQETGYIHRHPAKPRLPRR